MRMGTPGFVAARLIEAREARGFTQIVLSELTGIKPQSISHYEQGRQSPSPEALQQLAAALEVPERFFVRPSVAPGVGTIFFRQCNGPLKSSAKAARLKAERRLHWLKEITLYLRQYVDLPAVTLPSIPLSPEAGECREIEDIASGVRSALALGSGPAGDLLPVLEDNGWIAATGHLESDLGCSYSRVDGGVPYLMLCADERRASIAQYNIARELGHAVMHAKAPATDLDDPIRHACIEAQADCFARAFLMPAHTFAQDVWSPGLDTLLSLKKDWLCPIFAMVRRCGEIGVFDADQLRRAGSNLARRGWKIAEPRDTAVSANPRLLARSVEMLIHEGRKDRHGILVDLSLNPADVEELCGLAAGALLGTEASPDPGAPRLKTIAGETLRT